MITDVSRREEDRLTWSDVEMLPIYGAALLAGGFIVHALRDLSPALHGDMVKAALLVTAVSVQRWLAPDDIARD